MDGHDGQAVDEGELYVFRSDGHCHWDRTIFLGVERGQEDAALPGSGFYVRDPAAVGLQEFVVGDYSADATLPDDAIDTGYRSGAVKLWLSPSGHEIYLVGHDRVERWPQLSVACA